MLAGARRAGSSSHSVRPIGRVESRQGNSLASKRTPNMFRNCSQDNPRPLFSPQMQGPEAGLYTQHQQGDIAIQQSVLQPQLHVRERLPQDEVLC